ncbi:MAG: DUF86 domain-containing protein [Desulfomonilaceae bacterium]|nr:DUF86 domain-containing protein [Desulfomonilaceae bacterium]
MQKDDLVRMRHMLDAAKHAVSFVEGKSRADLGRDNMLAFALVRAFEVIGEAASKISQDTRHRFSDIAWPKIVGMRNRLIHGYDDINLDILWETTTIALPPLIRTLERIIGSE